MLLKAVVCDEDCHKQLCARLQRARASMNCAEEDRANTAGAADYGKERKAMKGRMLP